MALRAHVSSNIEGILDEVYVHLERDVTTKPPLWAETSMRELAVFVNVSIDQTAQTYLLESK